jgi:SNF2 family DNA or RNA helicase
MGSRIQRCQFDWYERRTSQSYPLSLPLLSCGLSCLDSSAQAKIVSERILPGDFDILIASYEMCLREKSALKKLSWAYIVIDEAHRIKNVDSMLSQIVRLFDSRGRMLITGTPLQNNLHELWALLK